MNIKVKIAKMNLLELCLFIIFMAQIIMSIYFNVALLGEHMGYDSSWVYLKAGLIWDERTLISDVWQDQTNVFWDSSMLLASLLYGITGNLLVSYGIANSIVLIGLVWCMYGITKDMHVEKSIQLLCINLLICPYLMNGFIIENDLGYFNCLISGPAFYSVRALLFLMIIRVVINLDKGNKSGICIILSLLLCVLTGMSSGMFMVIMILFPCILYYVEIVLIDNKLSGLKQGGALYVYACLFCSFFGKMIGKYVLKLEVIDDTRTWVSIERIWTNIGAVIQGMMKLLNIFPISDAGIPIMSGEGICRVFSIVIFAIVVVAFVFCVSVCIKNLKTANRGMLLNCNIVVCNFIVFCLFNVAYGSPIFEERYLICTFLAMIILVAYFFDRLDKKLILSWCLEGVLILGILGTNLVSDYKYVKTTNDYLGMSTVKEIVDTTDAELVYCWGNDLNLLSRNMRVYDFSRIYKAVADEGEYLHWGDYLYYDNKEDYTGPTVLIVSTARVVPEEVLNHYSFIGSTDQVNIYYSQDNSVDFISAGQ